MFVFIKFLTKSKVFLCYRAKAWAIYCWPEKNWTSIESLTNLYTKHKMLCGRHFEDSCFIDSNKKRLGKFSVPGSSHFTTELMSSLRADTFDNTPTDIMVNQLTIPISDIQLKLFKLLNCSTCII